jgi:hypothetical protein
MMTDRKKPGVAFWASVVLICLPLLYVLSFGPACWITSRTETGASAIGTAYWPIMPTRKGSIWHKNAIALYSGLGSKPGWSFVPSPSSNGYVWADSEQYLKRRRRLP